MTDLLEKIAAIEKEIRETPYHKGTEHHLGQLKARLAKLKKQTLTSRKTKGGLGFAMKKAGDATVVLIGPPSVGKSTLLNELTGAHARVEPWPFTTLKVIPGMLKYKGAQIQIWDLPGIIGAAAKGKGRGREVLSAARAADLLILMLDIETKGKLVTIRKELKRAGIDLPLLVIINKIDLLAQEPKVKVKDQMLISAQEGIGLAELKEVIWEKLGLMRIYLKPRDKKPDFQEPLILRKEGKVSMVVEKLFPQGAEIKQILLWGPSARFPGQQVSLEHQLEDEDILTFI